MSRKTVKKTATPINKSLVRFVMKLGACSAPAFLRRAKSAVGAWKAADFDQRKWARTNTFERAGIEHDYKGERCWCFEPVSSAHAKKVLKAFANFRRTGEISL